LQVLELEVHDAEMLFDLLADGASEIGQEEFLKGVLRLKGQARETDVIAMMHNTDKIISDVKNMQALLADIQSMIMRNKLG
jgi:hypothetical protein